MQYILGVVGLVWGAMFSSLWLASIFGAAGYWIGVVINRSDEQRKQRLAAGRGEAGAAPEQSARPPLGDFASLRAEVLPLRSRVEQLEAGRTAASKAAAPRTGEIASPTPQPAASPSPVSAPAPVTLPQAVARPAAEPAAE